jgi:hypothetical protein
LDRKGKIVFLCLVVAQGAHSWEEYHSRLYEVFAPARAVSVLASDDPALGFLVVNVLLVLFALWCWALPIRLSWPNAAGFVWFWAVLETANGLGHLGLAVMHHGYFPGVVTAPLLLLFAGWVAFLQMRPKWDRPPGLSSRA